MAEKPEEPDTTTVIDRRPVPRGALPRRAQTWLLAGLAVLILAIILLTGQPERSARSQAGPATQPATADRVRDYQERLRLLDERAAREARDAVGTASAPELRESGGGAAQVDPLLAERRRRDYESLFASNVVFSRREENQRPTGRPITKAGATTQDSEASIDEIADAVLRATSRTIGVAAPVASPAAPTPSPEIRDAGPSPLITDPISAAGSLHTILEGTVIDTVLTNRLDGASAAPVNCLITNPVYSHSGHRVLIPAGARLLGETRPVQSLGETRLAVAFHRLLMPDGSTRALNRFKALNQIGDAGLRDRVNQHYLSTFGAASAVGLISGLSQLLGTAGVGQGNGDRTVVVAGGAVDAASQTSAQVMNRFLNRLPSITIREGHRVKVYVTSDLDLPEWSTSEIAAFLWR